MSMKRIRNGALAALAWLFCEAVLAVEPPPAHDVVAIVGANVVPMTGDLVLQRQTVLVSDGAITAVGSEDQVRVPRGAFIIKGHGKYLMPGLAEMHAHVPSGAESRAYRDDVLFLYVA